MGLLRPHIIQDNFSVGIWEITENLEDLLSEVVSEGFSIEGQLKIRSELKRRQWLAARLLIRSMEPEIVEVKYLDSKAPYTSGQWEISMTHSANRVGVMLSGKEIPGIDIQEIHDKILRVKEKFASVTELDEIGNTNEVEKLHLIWCAKEAIYKKCRVVGLVFSEDILIAPFELQRDGLLNASVQLSGQWTSMQLKYEFIDNYALVYTLIG